jgi:hypothetical protein
MVLSFVAMLSCLNQQQERSGQPSFFYTDATYKLMSDGFLLLTLSTEDPNHTAMLVAIAITLHEDQEAYTTLFSSIKGFVKSKLGFEWLPSYCLSDGAEAIIGALRFVSPTCLHLLCYFHLKKAVKRHIRRLKSSEEKKQILELESLIFYSIDLLHKRSQKMILSGSGIL